MGTESGRGSLTGAAAAPACPSVKARAPAASSLPLPALSLPFSAPPQPPRVPRRRRTSRRSVPQRPYRFGFTPPALAQAQNCPPPASVGGLQLRRRKVSAALVPLAPRYHQSARAKPSYACVPDCPLALVPRLCLLRRRSNSWRIREGQWRAMGLHSFSAFRTIFQPTQPSSFVCVCLRERGGRRCW